MAQEFYVYTHTKVDTGEVFYVGKGKGRRAWCVRRNPFWKNVAKKHGYSVNILKSGLREDEAFALERQVIFEFGRTSLCNLTDGGDGTSGYKWSEEGRRRISENLRGRVASEETRAKLSLAHLGKPKTPEQIKKHADAIRGRKLTPHHAEILRLSATGRKVSEETRRKISASNRGQVRSDETKRKLSESHLGNIQSIETRAKMVQAHGKRTQTEKDATYGARRKAVLCSNGMIFESLASATLWVKSVNPKASKGGIGKAAIGLRRSAYGFTWSYSP